MQKFEKTSRKKLGELLTDAGLVTADIIEQAVAEQQRTGRLLGEILIEQGHVKERDIAVVLTRQFQLPYLSLVNYTFTKQAVALVPAELCHRYQLIPLDQFGDVLAVAVSHAPSREALDEIKAATGCTLQPFVATASEIQRYLDQLAPFDAKAVAEARRRTADGAGKSSSWTDVFERAENKLTGTDGPETAKRSTGAFTAMRPAATAKPATPTAPPVPAKTAAEASGSAPVKKPAAASALSIFDIGEQRVTKRLEKPKES